jgi:hypothetical protein
MIVNGMRMIERKEKERKKTGRIFMRLNESR